MRSEVTVEDPPFACGEIRLCPTPVVAWRRLELCRPEHGVEFGPWQGGRSLQSFGEGRLPRAAATEDDDALHGTRRQGVDAA